MRKHLFQEFLSPSPFGIKRRKRAIEDYGMILILVESETNRQTTVRFAPNLLDTELYISMYQLLYPILYLTGSWLSATL